METTSQRELRSVPVRGRGVLVADDELEIREVLNDGLRHEGFSVWLAADGEQALDVYRSHCEAIDVVLLNVRLDALDGPATLVALQEITPQIPCCFMSDDRGRYTEERLRRFGARALLKKPFQIRDVARLLREVVEIDEAAAVRSGAEHEGPDASGTSDGERGGP